LGNLLIECVRRELAAGMIMMTLVFGWAFLWCCCCCCCCWAMWSKWAGKLCCAQAPYSFGGT
jgi:hypothetical protein